MDGRAGRRRTAWATVAAWQLPDGQAVAKRASFSRQKATFRAARGGLMKPERWPFAARQGTMMVPWRPSMAVERVMLTRLTPASIAPKAFSSLGSIPPATVPSAT